MDKPESVPVTSRSSNTNDLKSGTLVASLPNAGTTRTMLIPVGPVSAYEEWVR